MCVYKTAALKRAVFTKDLDSCFDFLFQTSSFSQSFVSTRSNCYIRYSSS